MNSPPKIGVVSCSGEGCVEGTLSRVATRFVLERLRSDNTVTICLPLFLTGEKGERMFAKYFPTIAVDGCEKKCAEKAIEKYSGKTAHSIVVIDLLNEWNVEKPGSRRNRLTRPPCPKHRTARWFLWECTSSTPMCSCAL